jgi:tetratricopeptide (TPR) repeat protein
MRVAVVALALLLTAGDALAWQDSRARQVYDRAIALEGEGNAAAGLALLWEASGLSPRDPEIQNRLGESLARMGALDAAIAAYRAALAARPDFLKAETNLILALVSAGQSEDAVARARTLLAQAPRDAERHFVLGLAQAELDVDGAIESFRRAVDLDPRHGLARYNLGLVLRRADRLAEAVEELTRALAVEARPEIHFTLGVIHWHRGDLAAALTSLRRAAAGRPKEAATHETLGAVLKACGDL